MLCGFWFLGGWKCDTRDGFRVKIEFFSCFALEVMFYTLAIITFGTTVPAGQFVPGIMIGSTYDRLICTFGAASFLGGSMRMIVSLCVIMVEITNNTRNRETLVIGLMLRSLRLDSSLCLQHNFSEFAKPVSSKGISINDIHLSLDDLEMYIDLEPFLNPSPYVVPEDMSLTKVYNIFRQLRLRHIFVVPRASRVIGVITRKDLLIEEEIDSTTMELQSTSVSMPSSSAGGVGSANSAALRRNSK
ncbi:hypothetical protein J1N35_026375 [Gossypium stocksii]|uniref:CBS domain-containing protein n=1 Tax=Gossypium stocksii TaxID=47602 RepID=A0A9D3V870_9ROSI|nr:hypothetical protein J1N35_026375 [Gossypium stocksii]